MFAPEIPVRKDSRLFTEMCAALLKLGHHVKFSAGGRSMQPNVLDGDSVVVAPAGATQLRRGDLALIENADGLRLHRVTQLSAGSTQCITSSDTAWQPDPAATRIFGKVVSLSRGGREHNLPSWRTRVIHPASSFARRIFLGARRRFHSFFGAQICIPLFFVLAVSLLSVPAGLAQTDLAVTSDTASASPLSPGDQITYTVVVINNGPNTATVPVFASSTPANTTFVSAGKSGGAGTWNCVNPAVGGTGAITCTRTTNMGNGSTTTFSIVVQVNAGTANGTVITNSVNISSTTADPTPANNTATASVTAQAPDISMTQTAAPNPVPAGGNITYTETVTNNGPTSAIGASLTQNTPANTTFVSVTPDPAWTCGTVPAVGGTGTITCTANAAIASGTTSANFTIVVALSAGATAGSTITNTATVSETGTDPTPANNSTTTSVTVGLADLKLTQTASVSAVAVSTNYNYTELVTDNGPTLVGSGTVTVYLQTPANTTFQAFAGTNWACVTPAAGNAGPINCTYNAAVASGASASVLTLTFQVNAGTAAGTTIQSSASVTNSTIVDPVPSNNTSITSIVVEPTATADLGVSMIVAPTPVFVSSNLTYTISVQNLGQAAAPVTASVLSDTLPATVTFSSIVIPAGWSCTTPAVGATGTVTCSITAAMPAAPAAGSTVNFGITVTAPNTATTLNNTATATLPGDPNAANNSATAYTVVQPLVCASPGRDGAGGTLTGIVNAYYPPSTAGALNSSATSVALGPAAASGAQTAIAVGDLLLIIQMQGATINSTNSSSYGDGLPGDPGSGSTALGSSGLFEFVTATSAVPVAGGTLNFTGTGPTGHLLNSYSYIVATLAVPQQTYQVIRVPQYTSATVSSGLVPLAWNGSVGGVLALDVSSQLTLGGTVALDALGFRGGGGQQLSGAAGAVTDYVTAAPANNTTVTGANASKGEGIAGTPRYLAPAAIITTTTPIDTTGGTPADTLPGGSYARGAPGNAGGGGTDGHPPGNDFNSGGGAGANGGSGGQGGYGWDSIAATNSTDGGFGGVAFLASTSALVMGGGGGSGTTNNGTYYISPASNGNGNGIFSSGGAGGGIAIIHTGSVAGTGTITSNGQGTLSTLNDSTGGAGAGGSIILLANSGGMGGLTVTAIGGNAGNAWPNQAPNGFPGERHGPGGGGGGGVIFLSAAPASSNVAGGSNGYTNTVEDSYGSTPGLSGVVATTHIITETPGTQPGAYCASADLSVTNSGSPAVVAPGGNITYTQGLNNAGPFDAVNAIFTESIPANTTFQSISALAGWTCVTPAVGATGTITCTNPDFVKGGSGTLTVVVKVGAATVSGTQIVDTDNITSGTSDPNLANNSSTVTTTVGVATSADLAVTNTASAPTVNAGSTVTMTAVVTNNGPASASSASFTEAIPTGSTFASLVAPAGWNCTPLPPVGGTGTITCTNAAVAAGATASFPVVLNVPLGTASGTVITATANITSPTPDSNPSNNSASASTTVATAGQADLAVAASGTPNPVSQGNNISYTQSVTNNGPAIETNATFTDTIPANTTLVSFTPPANWTCNTIAVGATGTFTCTLNALQTIAVGASVNFPLVVKVNNTTASGTTITNTPAVASTVGDPNSTNNSATVSTTVASPSQADVRIVKTASPEPVNQGTNLAYTLTVTNGGPAVAQGVSVSDVLPSQVTYVSSSASQGSCIYTSATTSISCALGSLSVGSSAVVTINVTANTFSSVSLSSNTATVSSTTSDPNSANNTSTAVSTIQSPTAVDIASFRAFTQPDGSVVLEWRTQEESRNLGFHIYREQSAARQRITPSLIAGSALLLRGSQPQHAAKMYRWIDAQPGSATAYWIEDVDINGTRTMHGPASLENASPDRTAALATSPQPQASPLLRDLHSASVNDKSLNRPLMMPRPTPPLPPPGVPRLSVADHEAVKISVDHEGWYRISLANLVAVGLDRDTDLRSLRLYAEGVEQPLLIGNSARDSAPSADFIEFYGTGIDTPFSGDRVYWLIRGNSSGKRIVTEPSASSGAASPNSFPFTAVREDRITYFAALLNGENNDNFFGAVVTSDPVDQLLELAHLDTSSAMPITMDLVLQGASDAQQHTVSVQLNGATIGQLDFFGQALVPQTFNVEASLLHEGANTVTLTALNGDNDISVVQSIQLHYPHTYAADADWLRATAPSGSSLHISGFSDAQVRVFDITDPLNISELNGKISVNSGAYDISFTIPGRSSAQRTILALSSDAVSVPESLAHHIPTFLDDRRAGADIVIISHPDFTAALAPLVRLRESQNHRVRLVTTEQVYDEYNFGERSPFAIRSFLNDAAAHWQHKPQSILLVGDASFDPRNFLGLGDFDFVPTRMIETAAFKTACDDWFSDFQSTGYATIPTGRLPVRNAADAQLVVSKIVKYEQGADNGPWNSQALLVADQNVNANFSSATVSAAGILAPSLQVSEILADGRDPVAVKQQLLAALNSGSLVVNYQGHGAEQQWSFTNFFNTEDAASLTNGGRLPVYILMDCLNGFFQDVYGQSLAESVFLAPNGGGVAVWASSGFTEQAPQASMNQAFLVQFTAHPHESIGQIILQAKAGTTDNDVRRTWILFGDPAMKIHFLPSALPANADSATTIPVIPRRATPVCQPRSNCLKGKLQE